jgi:ribosomal protein S21
MRKRANVRVEARPLSPHASWDERERNFRGLMATFRKACNQAGISKEIKKREYYESPGQERRRKQKEKEINLLKLQVKENFINQAPPKKGPKKGTQNRG